MGNLQASDECLDTPEMLKTTVQIPDFSTEKCSKSFSVIFHPNCQTIKRTPRRVFPIPALSHAMTDNLGNEMQSTLLKSCRIQKKITISNIR